MGDNNRGSQDSSAFLKVHREWIKKNDERQMKVDQLRNDMTPSQAGSMLERWQQESMLDQPYHHVESVKRLADMGNNKEAADCKKNNSSLGYLDPEDLMKKSKD